MFRSQSTYVYWEKIVQQEIAASGGSPSVEVSTTSVHHQAVGHTCPSPGPQVGSTVMCGVCRASRQRSTAGLQGDVIVIPYGQVKPSVDRAANRGAKPDAAMMLRQQFEDLKAQQQQFAKLREQLSGNLKAQQQQIAKLREQLSGAVKDTEALTADRERARLCADCGLELPLTPSGQCWSCRQVVLDRHERLERLPPHKCPSMWPVVLTNHGFLILIVLACLSVYLGLRFL